MFAQREAIHAALFNLLVGATGVNTPPSSRRFKTWEQVDKVEMPALFTMQRQETAVYRRGLPIKWELMVDVFLYVTGGNDPDAVLSTQINQMLDAIETALQPQNGADTQTMGGLVYHCSIEGAVEVFEGVLDSLGVVIIPIKIVTV